MNVAKAGQGTGGEVMPAERNPGQFPTSESPRLELFLLLLVFTKIRKFPLLINPSWYRY